MLDSEVWPGVNRATAVVRRNRQRVGPDRKCVIFGSMCPSIRLSACPPPSVRLSVRSSVRLSTRPPARPSVRASVMFGSMESLCAHTPPWIPHASHVHRSVHPLRVHVHKIWLFVVSELLLGMVGSTSAGMAAVAGQKSSTAGQSTTLAAANNAAAGWSTMLAELKPYTKVWPTMTSIASSDTTYVWGVRCSTLTDGCNMQHRLQH